MTEMIIFAFLSIGLTGGSTTIRRGTKEQRTDGADDLLIHIWYKVVESCLKRR
jgi:hypothetical protein